MCASQQLSMEQPTISRFDSQSTTRTLVGISDGYTPTSWRKPESDEKSPFVQTLDSKQWIDLEYLSPKIQKELRRQYDPSIKDESGSTLAKGAAKVKGWMRLTKQGINIRLRRKLGPDQDEVTDIHLVPSTSETLIYYVGEN